MNTIEMLRELREVLADELPTYGFSDLRALAYLNESQQKFCEDTGFFDDTITFTISTEAGKNIYPLDERIIRVRAVYTGTRCLYKISGLAPVQSAADPLYWNTSSNTGSIVISPTPTAVVELRLHVWRYPLQSMSKNKYNPELPMALQRACIERAAYKCYRHHDVELANSSEAMKHKEEYRQYVLEGRELKHNLDSASIVVGVNDCYQV